MTELAVAAAKEAELKEPAAELLARVQTAYVAALRPLAYEQIDMTNEASGAYEHYYKSNIADCPPEAMARAKVSPTARRQPCDRQQRRARHPRTRIILPSPCIAPFQLPAVGCPITRPPLMPLLSPSSNRAQR